jgi:methionyl-tRNA formyltransferase
MKKRDLRIIFMGTPDFAVETLRVLLENEYNIVGVITSPDRPAGRGRKLNESAVKKFATEKGLTVLQPEKFKNQEFLEQLKSLNANLQIVVAFRMLPEIVWDMPEYGTFNLHGSLLPQYRGAAPINWAIINGEKESGVTTFFIEKEIDTGNILFQETVKINPTDNAGILHDNLMLEGGKLVLKTVQAIEENNFTKTSQNQLFDNENELNPPPKIFKDDCKIDWTKDAQDIYNFIRGLSPYPCAWTELKLKDDKSDKFISFKIYEAEILEGKGKLELKTDNKTFLNIVTKTGTISIKEFQLAGKKRMKIADYFRGNSFEKYSF